MKIAIAGAGISGLATAFALSGLRPDWQISIFESSDRCGGKAWTEIHPQGYRCEWGVNGFLDNKPQTIELCRQLGLAPLRASDVAGTRYVYRHGSMNPLPETPPEFLTSRLLNVPGRLRVMAEVLIPRGDDTDESLKEFAIRRLGKEGFEALIDPMASGVFAGDPARMSLASCFPRIHELELQYGSLIKALVSLQFKAHREGRKKLPGAGPGGTLTSFGEGISELIERLEAVLAGSIRKNTPVAGVSMQNGDYQLQLENGTTEDFHALIMAVPAWVQSQLLDQLSPAISRTLSRVYYPPLSVVCLGYDEADIPPSLNGFGFLVPSTERKHILGAVIDSNVFPNRAPAGRALIRVMAGGSRAPGIAMREDSSLVDLVKGDLEAMTGIAAEPEFCRVYRHMRAIPQYHVGHGHLIDELADSLVAFPGLYLAGNAFKGVSLNDCVANAFRIADQITNGAK